MKGLILAVAVMLACATAAVAGASTSNNQSRHVTDIDGNSYTVTGIAYYDPATPASEFEGAEAGNRLVSVKFRVSDTGRARISDDANNDVTIIGKNKQIYQASFSDIRGCTNFQSGEFGLIPGGSVVGCVTFEIPRGVKMASVEWDGSGGFGQTTPAVWGIKN